MIDAIAEVSDAAPDAKAIVPELIDDYRMPRPRSVKEFVSKMNKARASAEDGASADTMPLYKNQLIRWGGAALGSQVLRGAG